MAGLVTSVIWVACGWWRRGSAKIAATAATSATQAATRTPMAMALTKALCAAATSSLPEAPPACCAGRVGGGDRAGGDVDDRPGAWRATSTLVSRDR